MKVLVTGKNGQLGWELSQTQATALSSEISAAEVLFVGSEELDITVASSVDQLVNEFQPDVVINLDNDRDVEQVEIPSEEGVATCTCVTSGDGDMSGPVLAVMMLFGLTSLSRRRRR